MPDVQHILADRFRSAVAATLGPEHASVDPHVRPANSPRFGDYQANLAMGLAKKIGRAPRDVAAEIVKRLDTVGVCDKVEVAGPGFINLYLSGDFVTAQLVAMAADADHLGVARADPAQTVVVDYSSPNVAKEMHVGHLRSTIIGDAIARVLGFQGHTVIRQNHIGDWGTQFGMLIQYLQEQRQQGVVTSLSLTEQYQAAKRRFDSVAGFADAARRRVVELQSGVPETMRVWSDLVHQSRTEFQQIYNRLGVLLKDSDCRGESFYNPMLRDVIQDLQQSGLLQPSQGAQVVFPPGFVDRDGRPQAMIVRKSDGGYLYATTDLAAARYRIDKLAADRLIYVTDARQGQHFAMLFATLRAAGWTRDAVRLEHVPFGSVLGKDGTPFKTRQGGTVRLVDLLDEAQRRAAEIIRQKNPDLADQQRLDIARAVGIGALKYADLSNARIKDYVFDWDRMLSFEGNTAPYLQNAFVRIKSIFRKGAVDESHLPRAAVTVHHAAERAVAVKLLQVPAVVQAVADSLEPHRLCTFLYELASLFHQFYEKCPVLGAQNEQDRDSRLALCSLVARTLNQGLALLGIHTIERM